MASRDAYLKRKYGITEAEYDKMHEDQGGKCRICGKRQRNKRLSVDHDHVTGHVRALLCQRCNEGLGRFEWDDAVLERLIDYCEAIVGRRVRHAINARFATPDVD